MTTFHYQFLFLPTLIASTCLYASAIIEASMVGALPKALIYVLRIGSIPWGLLVISLWTDFPAQMRPPILALCGVVALVQARILVRSLSGVSGERGYPVFDFAILLFAAFVAGSMVPDLLNGTSYSPYSFQLASVFTWTLATTGVTAIFGAFRDRGSKELRWLTERLSSGLPQRLLVLLLIFTYIFIGRGTLSSTLSFQQTYLTIFEWVILCLGAYLAFRSYRGYVKKSLTAFEPEKVWGKHMQTINWQTDRRLSDISEASRTFIEGGGREMLVTRIFQVMPINGDNPGKMADVIAPLVNHQDEKHGPLTFSWQIGSLEKMNRERRRRAVEEAMTRLENYLRGRKPPRELVID